MKVAALFLAFAATAYAETSKLVAGSSLAVGEKLTSPNGRFTALMQGDGNFCVYLDYDPSAADQKYEFGTAQDGRGYAITEKESDYRILMQSDGNLVVRKGAEFLWGSVQSAGYAAGPGAWHAEMRDDGRFVVAAGAVVNYSSNPPICPPPPPPPRPAGAFAPIFI